MLVLGSFQNNLEEKFLEDTFKLSSRNFLSHINYIKTDNRHQYLSLIKDTYSKKIMGNQFLNNLTHNGLLKTTVIPYIHFVFVIQLRLEYYPSHAHNDQPFLNLDFGQNILLTKIT